MPDLKKVVTPPFRVSFPAIFEKSSFDGSEPKYSIVMIFDYAAFTDKEKAAFKAMKGLLEEACKGKFSKSVKDMGSTFKYAIRDGADKEHLDGYGEGKYFATASSKQQPGLIDRDKQPILDEKEFYPGCYARATVTAYAYDNKSKGVAFGLHNVQKLGDGENFTGRVAAEEDFGDEAPEFGDQAVPDVDDDDPLG